MASHSETFLRNVTLQEIRLIDRNAGRADTFSEPATLQTALNNEGIWPEHPDLAEALRIKRLVLCEAPADAELLSAFGKNRNPMWGVAEKMFQVILTEGSSESTVSKVGFVVQILSQLLNGDVRAAYLRDRDLMCDEWVTAMMQEAQEKSLHLFVTSRRNRESYLVDPHVVELTVLAQQDTVPDEWRKQGVIQGLVSEWCLEFCAQEQNALPDKVREYNRRWIQSRFRDDDSRRQANARLEGFIRCSWHEKIDSGAVPWALMDGRSALKHVRHHLAERSIMLPDKSLIVQMASLDTPEEFATLVDLICTWS